MMQDATGHTTHAARSAGGFTLVEILIAMLLLTVVLAGVLAMQVTALRASGDSRASSSAMVLASSRIEQYRALDYATLAGSLPLPVEVTCFGFDTQPDPSCTNAFFTRTAVVSPTGIGVAIAVTVQWGTKDGGRQFTMTMERTP